MMTEPTRQHIQNPVAISKEIISIRDLARVLHVEQPDNDDLAWPVSWPVLDLATWIMTGLLSNGHVAKIPPEHFADSFRHLNAVCHSGRGSMAMDEGEQKLWTARLENSVTGKIWCSGRGSQSRKQRDVALRFRSHGDNGNREQGRLEVRLNATKRGAASGNNFRAEAAVLWLCHDRDGTDTIYVVAELYGSGMTPEIMARNILAIDRSILIDCGDEIVANDAPVDSIIDSAAFSDSGMGSRADEMIRLGVKWKPSEKGWNSRLAGISAIHQRLAIREDGTVGPKIFKNCRNLIRELPSLTYDLTNPEDIDRNASDHCRDALRYALTRRKTRSWMSPVRFKV
jgi:hypothetical protein